MGPPECTARWWFRSARARRGPSPVPVVSPRKRKGRRSRTGHIWTSRRGRLKRGEPVARRHCSASCLVVCALSRTTFSHQTPSHGWMSSPSIEISKPGMANLMAHMDPGGKPASDFGNPKMPVHTPPGSLPSFSVRHFKVRYLWELTRSPKEVVAQVQILVLLRQRAKASIEEIAMLDSWYCRSCSATALSNFFRASLNDSLSLDVDFVTSIDLPSHRIDTRRVRDRAPARRTFTASLHSPPSSTVPGLGSPANRKGSPSSLRCRPRRRTTSTEGAGIQGRGQGTKAYHGRRTTASTRTGICRPCTIRMGADPILTIEISNLPEIVRVYTTLCR